MQVVYPVQVMGVWLAWVGLRGMTWTSRVMFDGLPLWYSEKEVELEWSYLVRRWACECHVDFMSGTATQALWLWINSI